METSIFNSVCRRSHVLFLYIFLVTIDLHILPPLKTELNPLHISIVHACGSLVCTLYTVHCTHILTYLHTTALQVSSFLNDLDKGKPVARLIKQRMPHVLPHRDRVIIFRNAHI